MVGWLTLEESGKGTGQEELVCYMYLLLSLFGGNLDNLEMS